MYKKRTVNFKISNHDDGTPSSWLKPYLIYQIEDLSAIRVHKVKTDSIQKKDLDIKNCCNQGYDVEWEVPRLVKETIRCVSTCLLCTLCFGQFKFGVADAMEAVTETHQFYDTIESIYDFFVHSIVRWQKLQKVHDCYCSNPTLKALNPTRWSGQQDAVYALKERFSDVIKLIYIILFSTKQKEKNKVMTIKKRIENFCFVIMLVV